MNASIRSYALNVSRDKFADSDAITVRVYVREESATSPINPRHEGEHEMWDAPKSAHGLALDRLQLRMWRGDTVWTQGAIWYDDLHHVDLELAEKHARTLKKIQREITKQGATEAGDVLLAFAKAIGATLTATPAGDAIPTGWLRDVDWRWSPIRDARDQLRRIMATVDEEKAKAAA